MRDYYLMKYRCNNCYQGYMVKIPFKQEALTNLECCNCGMNEVVKTDRDVEWFHVYRLENEQLVWEK